MSRGVWALIGVLGMTGCGDDWCARFNLDCEAAPPEPPEPVDEDGDVWTADTDCDDTDPEIHPSATDDCDGIDNDCDGEIDEDSEDIQLWYADADADGFGDPFDVVESCEAPYGRVENDSDCDDTVFGRGLVRGYTDGDLDGYGAGRRRDGCAYVRDLSSQEGDCDDTDPAVNPGVVEIWYDGVDSDCDGRSDFDADADGLSIDSLERTADCDDTDSDIGAPDPYFTDADSDGYGDSGALQWLCTPRSGVVSDERDCDDADPAINPSAEEVWYDGVDADCDGGSDHDADADGIDAPPAGGDCDDADASVSDVTVWHADADGDGFGARLPVTLATCTQPSGYVTDDTDCDDRDPTVHPGASDVWYDGLDADCDGADEYDADTDGVRSADHGGTDCDDADASVSPSATEIWYDGVDADCDGWSDHDADRDGFDAGVFGGSPSDPFDCDDADATTGPYALDISGDRVDNDCDGAVDDADAERLSAVSSGDDTAESVTMSALSIDLCGEIWTALSVDTNGRVTFGFTDSASTVKVSAFLSDGPTVAGLWRDLDPGSGGDVYAVEFSDAIGIYWVDVVPYGLTTPQTFSVVVFEDGEVLLDQQTITEADGLVGVSCATDPTVGATDLSAASVAPGCLGDGTESALYEVFDGASPHDLSGQRVWLCPQ